MKKVLLATSILAMSASLAAAEVTLSGDARMGVVDGFGDGGAVFSSRARVKFTMSGETDGGLAFGASFRAHDAGTGSTGAEEGLAGEVFLSGAFGRLAMGDVDSAANAAVGHVAGVGYTGLSDKNELAFIGGGTKESVLYEYSSGAFTGYLSFGQQEVAAETLSVAAKYSTDAFTVSLGYEDNDNGTDHVILGAGATFGAIGVEARYGSASGVVDGDQFALSATYTADALAVTVFYADDSELALDPDDSVEAFGIGASYDLGGGAKVAGGYVSDETNDEDAFDLGLTFSF